MTNFSEIDNSTEIPIESEEQAQLLEILFRQKAVAKVNSNLITLEGISCPADVGDDPHECKQCGNDLPAARIKALMTQVVVNDKLVWKANPNAVICVECATANEKVGRQYWHGQKDDSVTI